MDRIINWLFDNIQYVAISHRTPNRRLIKEGSAIDATTTVVTTSDTHGLSASFSSPYGRSRSLTWFDSGFFFSYCISNSDYRCVLHAKDIGVVCYMVRREKTKESDCQTRSVYSSLLGLNNLCT